MARAGGQGRETKVCTVRGPCGPKNLKLSRAERDAGNAGDRDKSEAVREEGPVRSKQEDLALSCSVRDHDKEEQPLETILVACLANTLLNRHVMSCEMVWAKERQ